MNRFEKNLRDLSHIPTQGRTQHKLIRILRGLFLSGILIALTQANLWADVKLPTEPKRKASIDLSLLDHVRNELSGRPWLMIEGFDPGLSDRPGWNPLTRLDWRKLDGGLQAGDSPVLQGAGGFLVPFRSPGPAFSRDILISRDFSGIPLQTEPHLAVDPDDPDHIVVAMIDYNFPSNTTYVSFDGGATWEGPNQTGYLPDDRVSGGDPVVAFDRKGNVYLASISIGVEEFTIGPMYTSSIVSSIAVARSTNGGFDWPVIVSTDRSGVTLSEQSIDPAGRLRGSVAIGFLDKPWMVVGRHHTDPNRDVIYMAYTYFETFYDIMYAGELPLMLAREMSTTIRLVTSEDGGLTWTDPLAVSPTVRRIFGAVDSGDAPGQFGTDRVLQGPRPAVDSRGNLYVTWLDSTDDGSMEGVGELRVAHSTDGGKTFDESVIAAVFNEIPFTPRNASFRYWGSSFPRIEVGPQGDIYLVYTARPTERPQDDGDIFFIRSVDRGETWTKPFRLNDDDGDKLQFFPEITVDPNGYLHVMWGDMRDDSKNLRYHIYYTSSEDRGSTWGFEQEELGLRTGDTRVTDFASNPMRGFTYGLFLGDYFGIASTEDEVYMVWPDTRLAEFGGINQKIAFARKRAIRAPDIFVSPSAGPGGEQITLQGFNFQPDMNVYVQLEDATISVARTNKEGRFTAGIYIPITGEGAKNIRVFDDSGNFATTSFYTEFGFNNIQELYEQLLDEIKKLNSSGGS